MEGYQVAAIAVMIFYLAIMAAVIYLFVLIIKALRKYVSSKEVREEKRIVRKSLSEALLCKNAEKHLFSFHSAAFPIFISI